MLILSILIIMYFRDQLSFNLAINPSQAHFCSLISPTQQVLSYMRTSSLVTMQIDRVLYFLQIQPDNVLHRLALMMLKFKGFMEKITIKQESPLFRQKRFRVFFSFKNQDIQKDQFRNLLDYFKRIGLVLMQHDKRKQLLVSFNAKQQTYSQFLYSLNKEVPMFKIIQRNQLIQWLIDNNELEVCRLNGLYIDKINQTTYLVFTDSSKLRMKITKKGELFKVAQLLNFAVQQNYKIEIVIKIGDTVNFYLDIKVNTGSKNIQINKIKEIIKLIVSQKIYLLYPTVQTTSENNEQNIKTFYIEAKTLEDIYQFMKFSFYRNTDTSPLTQQYCLKNKESTRFENIYNPKENYQSFSMNEISRLTDEYSRRNLLFLKPYWDSGLLDYLEDFYTRWEDYRLHWVEMCKFIRLLDYKSYQIQEKYTIIYPKSLEIIEKFMKKLGQKTIANRVKQKTQKSKEDKDKIESKVLNSMMRYLKIQDHVIDQIIKYLIRVQNPDKKDEKFRLSISNQLLKGKPVNFSNLIAVIEQFQDETSKWQDVLHLVFKEIYKITIVSKSIPNPCVKGPFVQNSSQKNKKYMNQEAYLDKIQNEKLIKVNCLGCSPHFLYNMNIKDNSVNSNNLVVFQKAEHLRQLPLQVKLSICGLLNSIEGGIILFGCQKKYLDIHTQGSVISQSMKRDFVQLIKTFRQSFYPKLQENNVIVNFVPIIANPYLIDPFEDRWLIYEGTMKELKSTKYVRRKYYEGTYVMRIIVRPIKQGMIHYFEHDQNQTKIDRKNAKENSQKNYKMAIFEDFRIVEIPISHLRKTIKKSLINHIDSKLSIQTAYILKIPSLSYHQCQQPEQGLPVAVKYDDVPQDTTNNWWQKYKLITQVVCKRKYLLEMRDNIRQMGYDCQVQRKFLQYDLQSARNTAIIYHDFDFSQLKYIIKNSRSFTRIAGEIQVFPIKSCVKISRNGGKVISLDDQRKLKKWFNTEFPSSILKTSESTVEKEKTVTYIKGSNKIQAFFIYLVLRNFNENAVMEDESAKIIWKVFGKESEILFISADYFKNKLCLQAQQIYDFLLETTKNNSEVNISKPTQQAWIRHLCFSLINEDDLSTWQRMLERGQRKDLVVKFIQKMAESKKWVIYLGEKLTNLWKKIQYEDKDDSNLEIIDSLCSLQAENQPHQNSNYEVRPLQIAKEVQLKKEMESQIMKNLMNLKEQTTRRHSKLLQNLFQSQIPEFCINQIAEQRINKQFSKIVFNVRTTEQFLKIRDKLESIAPLIEYEIAIDYQKVKQEYFQIILFRLLTWTNRFQEIKGYQLIELFERLLFEDKALSDYLIQCLQKHAESLWLNDLNYMYATNHKDLKSIDLLLSSKIFALCSGDKLDNTQTVVKGYMEQLQFMQAQDQKKHVPQHSNEFAFEYLQYINQQLNKMQECSMIQERIHNWIKELQNKLYGRMMANAHYISQLLSKLKGIKSQNQQQIDRIIRHLVEFIEFVIKEIAKISFKSIKESFWLFNLLKNSWLFQDFKQLSSSLTQKIDYFEKELIRNLLRMIDEFLLEKQQKINLQKFVYILEKARQLLPLQQFSQFSSYKKEYVLKILRFKINWQTFKRFPLHDQQINHQSFSIIIDALQSIEFQHYIRDFLIIDVEQIKKRYKQTAPPRKHQDYKKGQSFLRKVYYHQEQQIIVTIKKGNYWQNEIVIYSKIKRIDKKDYLTFVRLQRDAVEQFLFQHELELLNKKIPKKADDQNDVSWNRINELTTKWLLQKLMKKDSSRSQTSTQSSQITSSEDRIQNIPCSQSQVKDIQSLQIQIKQSQQEIILHLFNLYIDQYHKVKANIEYSKDIGKGTFLEIYQIFQSLKRYKPFTTIINQECFAEKATKEINTINDRSHYFPQEDFIGLDPVQTYKNILAFMEENKQLQNSINELMSKANTSKEKLDKKYINRLQELYELIAEKQDKIQNNPNNETLDLLIELRQILQIFRRNKRKEPIVKRLIQKQYKIQKNILKSVNNFFLNVDDSNQIQNQLFNYINKLEFTRRIDVLEGKRFNIDVNKVITQFKDIHHKAKEEVQKMFDIGSENKYFNTIFILINLVKKSKTAVGDLKEHCDQFKKDLSLKILEVISKEIQSNDKKITELKQKEIKGAEAYYLNTIEQDIRDLEVSIMKIVKLNKMQPENLCLVDLKENKYFEIISRWKIILQENNQTMSDNQRFGKNLKKKPRTSFDLSEEAFHRTIKAYHQQFREEQKYQTDSFCRKMLKVNPQNLVSLEQKMKLLGKIMAIFDITHHQLRTFRSNYKKEMTVQTAKINQQLRQKLCEIALKIKQKQETSKIFVINDSLQDRVIAMGIISIYLALTTQKEVSIACSPFFANKSQHLFQQVLKNCNLQNKVKVFTYKQALVDALSPIIKATDQEISRLFNNQDKDMEKIMIQRKGDQMILFPKINKKILMVDQATTFFDFLKKENVFIQTMTLSDPMLQNFLKMIKKTVSSNDEKFLTKILMQNRTKTFFKEHQVFDKILIQQTKKMIRDVKDYKSSYQIIKGKLIHEDCNGRLNEDLHYGYKTIFSIFEEFQAERIASVHKKSAVKMEIMLNVFDLLALDVYFEKIYGLVEYENSLCTPTAQYFISSYNIQKETITQLSKDQNNREKRRNLLAETIKKQQDRLEKILYFVQQASQFQRILILKDNKQIQQLTRQQKFALLSRQSWILKSEKDTEWPFNQQNQHLQKNVIITTQECFKFILKDMLIYQMQREQAKNTIIFCSFKPKELHPYIHIEQYIDKIVFIEVEDILDRQAYRDLQEQKCLESLKNQQRQNFLQKNISRYRFVNNILALNMIQSRLLPNHNIILCINSNSESLRLFDFRLLIHTIYQQANTRQFNLFIKVIVFRGAHNGKGKCRYVETPFNDDPNPLLCFLKNLQLEGHFDPADTQDMLEIIQAYPTSRYFVFVEYVQKIVNVNEQKVKLMQMPYKKHDLSFGQTLYDLYKQNQVHITQQILREIQIIGHNGLSNPPSQ